MLSRCREPSLEVLARALRLVNEVRDQPRGSVAQRLVFLRGLAELVHAQVGIWVEVAGMRSGKLVLGAPLDFGWESEGARAIFGDFMLAQELEPDPTYPNLARVADGEPFVCARQALIDDRSWYSSSHVQELRRRAGVDQCLLGGRRQGDRATAFSLHRPWGDKAFEERDERVLEIVWHEAGPYLVAPLTLPPRLASVLDLLCRGASEKEIAFDLALSPHTVHGYVKELHARFQAQSRGELLAKALGPRPR